MNNRSEHKTLKNKRKKKQKTKNKNKNSTPFKNNKWHHVALFICMYFAFDIDRRYFRIVSGQTACLFILSLGNFLFVFLVLRKRRTRKGRKQWVYIVKFGEENQVIKH